MGAGTDACSNGNKDGRSLREAEVGMGKQSKCSLVEPQPAAQKDGREHADEEDERAARHLIDGHRGVQEADVHQLRRVVAYIPRIVPTVEGEALMSKGRQEEGNQTGHTVVPVRSQAAGNQRRRIFQPRRCWAVIWAFDPATGSSSASAGSWRGAGGDCVRLAASQA